MQKAMRPVLDAILKPFRTIKVALLRKGEMAAKKHSHGDAFSVSGELGREMSLERQETVDRLSGLSDEAVTKRAKQRRATVTNARDARRNRMVAEELEAKRRMRSYDKSRQATGTMLDGDDAIPSVHGYNPLRAESARAEDRNLVGRRTTAAIKAHDVIDWVETKKEENESKVFHVTGLKDAIAGNREGNLGIDLANSETLKNFDAIRSDRNKAEEARQKAEKARQKTEEEERKKAEEIEEKTKEAAQIQDRIDALEAAVAQTEDERRVQEITAYLLEQREGRPLSRKFGESEGEARENRIANWELHQEARTNLAVKEAKQKERQAELARLRESKLRLEKDLAEKRKPQQNKEKTHATEDRDHQKKGADDSGKSGATVSVGAVDTAKDAKKPHDVLGDLQAARRKAADDRRKKGRSQRAAADYRRQVEMEGGMTSRRHARLVATNLVEFEKEYRGHFVE